MTATEEPDVQLDTGYPHTLRPELHKALTARGIDYWVAQGLTFWSCPDGRECVAYGYQANGKPMLAVKIAGITDPEQAIAATLGAGTCKADKLCDGYLYYTSYWCRGCDERFAYRPIGNEDRGALPKFCPNCGCAVFNDERCCPDCNTEVVDE